MRTAPCLAATFLFAAAGCRSPAGDMPGTPDRPDVAEAPKPRHTEVKAFACDCACDEKECSCRPLRSGACICLDKEGHDCACTCEGREVVSISEISGLSTPSSPAAHPPERPAPDHLPPPPPPPPGSAHLPPPGLVE